MRQTRLVLGAVGALLTVGVAAVLWLRPGEPPPAPAPVAAPPAPPPMSREQLIAFFQPPTPKPGEAVPQDTPAQVALGHRLFFEPRLSKNHDISCNSCHELSSWGVDHKPTSEGHRGQKGARNAPTVYHAAWHVAQFWDGRAATLEEQAQGPVLNPIEMAMPDEKRVVATLSSMPEYMRSFQEAFPGQKQPVSLQNAARAIAAFERQLVTTSRFDRFLAGEEGALSAQERRGLEKFVLAGCTACHNGPGLGGGSFQKLGLVEPYPDTGDQGRYAVTKSEEDLMKFRVPTLRNVAKTGPYFHNGSVPDLPTAVRLMGKHQLGVTLQDSEVEDLVAFLSSLTGELPASLTQQPVLPPSTPRTPRPDPT